jgi:hypothetical protein
MPSYDKLRQLVSHRVTFEYDTGAKIVGYITACKPPTGPVQLVNLARAEILDATGRTMESHAEFSFVPNGLVGIRQSEGPSERGPQQG